MSLFIGTRSISRVWTNTDQVGCVLVSVAVGRGAPWPASSSLRGPSFQVLTLLRGAGFIVWRLRRPFFRGMPMGSEAFLEPPGASGLRLCARTHLKKALCHTRPVGGRLTNTARPLVRFFRIRTRKRSSQGMILHLVVASALHLRRYAKKPFLMTIRSLHP